MRTRTLAGMTILFVSTLSHAGFFVGKGATGSSSLKIPVSARGTALAGAFAAVSGDVGALEYNPAGLVGITRADINATLDKYVEDASLQSLSIGFPFQFRNTSYDYTGLNKIFFGVHYRGFKAEDSARDYQGIKTGDFKIEDQVIQLGTAYAPSEKISIGLSGKTIKNKVAQYSSSNFLFDGGIILMPRGPLSVGVSLMNFGSSKAFLKEKDPPPSTIQAGVQFQTPRLSYLGQLTTGRDKITTTAAGLEFKPFPVLSLRTGLLFHTTVEFSGGLGILFSPNRDNSNYSSGESRSRRTVWDQLGAPDEKNKSSRSYGRSSIDFGIDYAFRSHNELGLSHTVTFKLLY